MVVTYRDSSIRIAREHAGDRPFHTAYELGSRMKFDELVAYALKTDAELQDIDLTVLTRRELEVARLVAAGLSNRDIATDLTISQRTVETHIEHILSKLALQNRTKVAAWIHARTHSSG
ncbi:LuxR C-terminal-related transcriptional regulator [Rhodococcus opacus]|uniref:LuxR C-terminal-related transcriptional regulator n=1 Tax=Rhodococcus opacus TaxID=37919 RepID=A0AAX3Y626_RHOOP|nr:LuxR C-terminal-related transcriptional regulator [Rhodococcus opacus]MCZ4590021.1 LuxR C-terminal-related transcriptional regulator [Rhodococcus opacus]WLF44546.1 LuxR C-terminal-related transcriptional regulator [Rhodococcus opacus]